MTTVGTLVLVEGDSDAGAVRALADLTGCDLDEHRVEIRAAHGVTNFPSVLTEFVNAHPRAGICGIYDVAEERHVRRALIDTGASLGPDDSLESLGFFACVADLEDELIRALGTDAVERVLEGEGDLRSFRRFQGMPQQRLRPVHDQLRRFLGTRATRKIRVAQLLVAALDVARLPRPLAQLTARLREVAPARRRE